jgi:hypothetical protein
MKIQKVLALAFALAALEPAVSTADTLILDTGAPTGTTSVVLNKTNWYAVEFYATQGETIDQLSAYLTAGAGGTGSTFTWDIYSSTAFTGANRAAALLSAPGTFATTATDPWTHTAVDWTAPTTGLYWVALQVGTGGTAGLDLQTEASAATGTVPASGFAYAGTNGRYATLGAPAIGVEVSAVPLPAALWLLGSGLMGFGLVGRQRRVEPSA